MNFTNLLKVERNCLKSSDIAQLAVPDALDHSPRTLMLHGSLHAVSYSHKSAQEGASILQALGCKVRMLDPIGLQLSVGRVRPTQGKTLVQVCGGFRKVLTQSARCIFWGGGCGW